MLKGDVLLQVVKANSHFTTPVLKNSNLIPFHKEKNLHDRSNYRPQKVFFHFCQGRLKVGFIKKWIITSRKHHQNNRVCSKKDSARKIHYYHECLQDGKKNLMIFEGEVLFYLTFPKYLFAVFRVVQLVIAFV